MKRELLRSVAEDLLVYLDGPGNSTQRTRYRGNIPIGKPAGAGMLDTETRDRTERRPPDHGVVDNRPGTDGAFHLKGGLPTTR
jgi:hypothetical protein